MDKKEKLTQIVKDVQKDKGQFELLYSQVVNRVYFWCFTVIGNESESKDIAQEVMIHIYKQIDKVDKPEYFTSWMYRLTRNYCINYLQREKKLKQELLGDDEFSGNFESVVMEERGDHLPPEAYDIKEKRKLIASFIEKLPRRQREVITLYYIEEMRVNEIAQILDYNRGSVKSRLHSGRKNLESQIKEYQTKHNVKLYSTVGVPTVGLLLNEYYKDISSNHTLTFDKSIYNAGSTSLATGVGATTATSLAGNVVVIIMTKIILVTVIAAACIAIVVTVINDSFLNDNNSNVEMNYHPSMISNYEMYEKLKGNSYIRNISYLKFPMRSSLDVNVQLKKDVKDKDLKIMFNNEEIYFERDNRDILLQIEENGVYTIITEEFETTFTINNMNEYAPELIEVFNEDNYLYLIVNDELSQIDYEKSYVEYQGKIYTIEKDLKVYGVSSGLVKVTIFHRDGYYITYSLTLE